MKIIRKIRQKKIDMVIYSKLKKYLKKVQKEKNYKLVCSYKI